MKPTPYLQSTPYTTAAASLLNILHHIRPNIKLTKAREFHIWQQSAILPTRGSSIFALALYAKLLKIDPTVIVESLEYNFPDYRFYRYTKQDILHASLSAKIHLDKALRHGVKVINRKIYFDELTPLLTDHLVLLRVNIKPLRNTKQNSSQYIAIISYKKQKFTIIDPGQGTLQIKEEILQEAFNSLTTKKHRDHRMILFQKTK